MDTISCCKSPSGKGDGLVDLLINYRNDLDNVNGILDNILTSANELDVIIRKIAIQTEDEL